MASKKCFKHNCNLEVKYICKCSDFETHSCDLHFGRHLKLANRTHRFESILLQPDEEIKGYTKKQEPKIEKMKKNAVTSKPKKQSEIKLKRRKIESDIATSTFLKEAIRAYSNSKIEPDEEACLNTTKKSLLDFQLSSDISKKWNRKFIIKRQNKTLISGLNYEDLTEKISMIWKEGNNPETERDFRRIYSL